MAVMGLAYPFSLVFEVPFANLDKMFLSPRTIKRDRTLGSRPDEAKTSQSDIFPVNPNLTTAALHVENNSA